MTGASPLSQEKAQRWQELGSAYEMHQQNNIKNDWHLKDELSTELEPDWDNFDSVFWSESDHCHTAHALVAKIRRDDFAFLS